MVQSSIKQSIRCCVSSFGIDNTMAVADGNFAESRVWVESISTFSREGSATMGDRCKRNDNGKQLGCWNNEVME
jgi:hypothetical protein